MKKVYAIILSSLFCAVIVLGAALTVFLEKPDFSEEENRYLADFPRLSSFSLENSDYFDKVETFLSDRFPMRKELVSACSLLLYLSGNREIGGAYVTEKGYIERWSEKEEKNVIDNCRAIEKFCTENENINTEALIIPTAARIYKELLPSGAPNVDQDMIYENIETYLENVRLINPTEYMLASKQEQLFYKTDPHINTRGAAAIYKYFCSKHGFELPQNLTYTAVSDTFYGTLDSKVLYDFSSPDDIEICRYNMMPTVHAVTRGIDRNTLYDNEKLSQKDKYSYFLGGNYGEITISTYGSTGRNLLVFKDSFANVLVPYLIKDYDTIHLIDPRYYYYDLDTYIQTEDITDCLFIYNIKNFSTDSSLYELLG